MVITYVSEKLTPILIRVITYMLLVTNDTEQINLSLLMLLNYIDYVDTNHSKLKTRLN